MIYPIRIKRLPDGYQATLVDFPNRPVTADTRRQVIALARIALLSSLNLAIRMRTILGDALPVKKGQIGLELSVTQSLKLMLYKRLLDLGWTKKELAVRMGCDRSHSVIDRLFDLHHDLSLERAVTAVHAMGLCLTIELT